MWRVSLVTSGRFFLKCWRVGDKHGPKLVRPYLDKLEVACRCCCDDVGSSSFCELNGNVANTATPAVNEHTLPRLETVHIQRLHSRQWPPRGELNAL